MCHNTRKISLELEYNRIERIPHPNYSPDVSPYNLGYSIFQKIKGRGAIDIGRIIEAITGIWNEVILKSCRGCYANGFNELLGSLDTRESITTNDCSSFFKEFELAEKRGGDHDSCYRLYIEKKPVLAKFFMSASAPSAGIRSVLVLSSPPPFTNDSKSLQTGARRFWDFGPIRCISNSTDTGLRLAQVLTDSGTTMIRHSGIVRRTGSGSVPSLEGCELGPSSIILFEKSLIFGVTIKLGEMKKLCTFQKVLDQLARNNPKTWPNRKNLTFEHPAGHGESNSDP
jgi:hypothetical protein